MRFALIPPGTFLMGSPPGEKGRYEDETQHQVTISKPFYMGITPVTQEQYEAMMGVNPSYFHAKPGWLSRLFGAVEDSAARQRPVEQVSWSNAMDFCKKLSARINKTVSLPTEAQWEYACRAGTTGPYAGSGNLDDMAWYLSNSGGTPHPVGQKKPNAWGLHDMHGNVWEWCSDWYDKYPSHAVTDPTGPGNGQSRVLRGGSWDYIRDHCRAAYRRRGAPGLRSGYIGFRVCLDLD
jgi:formylglycine-generating enzyme required for sulfatase activity